MHFHSQCFSMEAIFILSSCLGPKSAKNKQTKKAIVCFLVVGVALRIFDLDVITRYYAYQECVAEIVQDSLHTKGFHKGSYLSIGRRS